MAYGKKYEIRFRNRLQNDYYRCEIWQKDFVGDPIELTGADTPFVAEWSSGDIDPLTPIKSIEFTISFLSKNLANTYDLAIEDFYSDDDQEFRVDHYFEDLSAGGAAEKLLHSGYLIQDGASEPLTDRKHVITLKATDNLALLKNIKWNEIGASYDDAFALGYYVRYCLEQTGLYASATTIPMSLPLRIFDNLYENTIDDRTTDDVADPYHQIILYSGIFKNSDGTWKTCYEVLETVLKDMNADLIQANGCWNVRRVPEYSLFTNGVVPGTEYVYNGSTTDIAEVFLDDVLTIDRNGTQVIPFLEDQTKGIQRPLKSVKDTFNFNSPPWLQNADLVLPDGATPFDTNTVGDLRYDDYDIGTYFPGWKEIGTADTSYLEVVTDTSTPIETEVDRYIVSVFGNAVSGIRFNPIPVTKGDLIDFSFRFRTDNDVSGDLRFYVNILLVTGDCSYYIISTPLGDLSPARWAASGSPIVPFYAQPDTSGDTTEWMDFSVLMSSLSGDPLNKFIPADGILLIDIYGTNGASDHDDYTTYWKDVQLTIYTYVTNSLQVIGQSHLETGTSTIKATEENEISLDDSPRNSIAGTLFTDDITSFCEDIGNIYFTRTTLWHRSDFAETKRLGNIISLERLRLKFTSRSILEGTFKNVRYALLEGNGFISPLNLFKFGAGFTKYTDKFFLPASMSVDYMAGTFKARLIEIFKAGDGGDTDMVIILNAEGGSNTYSTTGFSQDIEFSDYDATEFTANMALTEFTYTGGSQIVSLETSVSGLWTGATIATLVLYKNGVSIGTYTIGSGISHFFNAQIFATLLLNPGDVIKVEVTWPGSSSYTLQVFTAGLVASATEIVDEGTYLFNYIYDTT